MKVIKNGVKVEMTYEEVCEDLGNYIPEMHFVEITTQGRIGFTAGKPDEVKTLASNIENKGYLMSTRMKEILKGI